jgi:ABC-type transport system involved in multi-copper enzyme maturation permease subunit
MNVLRSEWTKLRSPRSSQVCGALMVLAMFGIAIALGARWAHQDGALPDNFDATNVGLSGVDLSLVIVGSLGVLSISSEYATGMIHTSIVAVPQRASVLAAKAVVLAAATLVVSEVLAFASFLVCQAFLAHVHGGVSLGDPGVMTAVIGSGLFLTAVSLLGLGLGAALRHTAGAIAALFTVLFALPAVIDLLPTNLRNDVIDYLPLNAASQILETIHKTGALSPWAGLGVFALYVLAALAAGFAVIVTRDA